MEKGKEKEKVALSSFKLGVPLMGPFFFLEERDRESLKENFIKNHEEIQ